MGMLDKITSLKDFKKEIIADFKQYIAEYFDGELILSSIGVEDLNVSYIDAKSMDAVVAELYKITLKNNHINVFAVVYSNYSDKYDLEISDSLNDDDLIFILEGILESI